MNLQMIIQEIINIVNNSPLYDINNINIYSQILFNIINKENSDKSKSNKENYNNYLSDQNNNNIPSKNCPLKI